MVKVILRVAKISGKLDWVDKGLMLKDETVQKPFEKRLYE